MAEMPFICGGRPSPEVAPHPTAVVLLPYECPLCEAEGVWGDGTPCVACGGRGALSAEDAQEWAEAEPATALKPTAVPPAVMRAPCGDCAFRPGAPEQHDRPPPDRPFYCHHGMPVVGGAYSPVAWAYGQPLGSMVYRGWWDAAQSGQLPEKAYRPARDGWDGGTPRDVVLAEVEEVLAALKGDEDEAARPPRSP